MKKSALKWFASVLLIPFFSFGASGGTLTDNFSTSHDYVANGITGTIWDGIYLGFGDIPGGNNGGDGNGATFLAASANPAPGLLNVQTINSSWAGAGDDGFLLYKIVAGDFDTSVVISSPYDAQNFNFAGLMARAAQYPSGAPFGGSENWMDIARFQEFSIGTAVRFATNGADTEIDFPGDDTDTNSILNVRITRVGDVFSFYNRVNLTDPWTLLTNFTRADLSGVPMQVGIMQATFTGNTPQDQYSLFQLSGPNVNPTAPPAPAANPVFASVNSNSLSLSWVPGAGSTGSLVVVRAGQPTTHQPSFGVPYNANATFGSGDHLGGGNYVVFSGSATNVTITGLGGSNITYYASVYAYSGSGTNINYSLLNAPTTNAPGPGVLQSISLSVPGNRVVLNGVGLPTVFAVYNSGTSNDVSTQATFSSDNSAVISTANNVLSALASGSANITASYSGFNTSILVTVGSPAFTDDFSVTHDYLTNGLPGSKWDGLYLGFGDIPGGDNGGDVGSTSLAVAGTNVLNIATRGTTWAGTADDGFLLFKNVPGDFQAQVHLGPFDIVNFNFVGLMARASDPGGAPFGGSENWVYWSRFDEFGDTTLSRTAIDGADNQFPQQNGITNRYLLMVRQNGSNFLFFDKQNLGDPWTPEPSATIVRPDLVGVPMQVGLFQATYTPSPVENAQFDSFALDGTNINTGTPPTAASNLTFTPPNGNPLTLNWTPGAGSVGSVVVMRAGSPVNLQPVNGATYTGNAAFGSGDNLGDGNFVVYSGPNNTVTVSNLTFGVTYYAAVYSYSGSGATITYNQQTLATSSQQIGVLQGISALLADSIPVNGVGLPLAAVTGLYSGGASNDVTSGATLTSDNSNIVAINGIVLSGISNGAAHVTVSYRGFSNTFSVVVRSPKYSDDFTVSHDYLANGVTNTIWDGIYTNGAPGSSVAFPGTDGPGATTAADANISSNGVFTVQSSATDWEDAGEDGFFLFKNVVGDFQTAVHITAFDTTDGFDNPGLMARAYGAGGAPLGGTNGETWVSWTRFDEFGITTYARATANNVTTRGQTFAADTDLWLLLARVNGTNFLFFQKQNLTDPWKVADQSFQQNFMLTNFAGLPLQVGLQQSTFQTPPAQPAQFDHFMLDLSGPTLHVAKSGANVLLSWPASATNYTLQATPTVQPGAVNWNTISVLPGVTNGNNVVAIPFSNAPAFFRLIK